jgi:uncharacterized protein (TIGR04255 family)
VISNHGEAAMQDQGDEAQKLPSYESPPVSEVSLGIVFKPIEQIRAPHFGLFWEKIRSQYPKVEHAPPIGVLQFGPQTFTLPRIWYISANETELIQLQNDRLLFNWRKQRPTDTYPRFGAVRSSFLQAWQEFQVFAAEINADLIQPQELSLEYINNIFRGEGWESRHEIGHILRDARWEDGSRFLPPPTDLAWRASFDLPKQNGHLALSAQFGVRLTDQKELLQLQCRAHWPCPDGADMERAMEWYEFAHKWVVCAFTDVTTPETQKGLWKRIP